MPPDWKSAIEIHPADWVCPAEPFWVAGWATSSSGLVPVDVRAWLGRQPFLGLCGLPRPDKEIEARGQAGPPHAGFSLLLKPVSGAKELRIEICDQTGRWTEIFRQSVTCPDDPARPAPLNSPEQSLLRLLEARQARPGEGWTALAREILAAEEAETFDVMPSSPFQGALEQLEAVAAVQYEHLLVTGWVAHREQAITSLTAFLDAAVPLPLVHGLTRPDAGELFPDLVNGAHSRFAGYLKISARLPRPVALRIFATLADGRQELVFLKRFRPVLTSGRGTDLPPFSPWKFICAARALRAAGWNPAERGGWREALRHAWHDYRLAAPAGRLPKPAPADPVPRDSRPLRVILVTHNLNFEGAPLFLLEYARYLANQPGWKVEIVSPEDGPLRAAFATASLEVRLVDSTELRAAHDEPEFQAALDKVLATLDWAAADVIVANTLVAFWAVHLAHRLRRPSIFYVHESVSARRFFALSLPRPARLRAEWAFTLATRVAFPAGAARRPHLALASRGNFRVLPGWIDVARIRAYEAAHSRAALRRAAGFADDAVIFANIGSMLPRKGQHVFLAAIELLQPRLPVSPPIVFLLVGAKPGPDPYVDVLRHTLATRALSNVHLIAQSADPYQYFQAADICVCSSLEEALPRVLMEAAVFGRLIVSTDVDGVPELLGPDEAWLVPPDDPARLADAMQSALEAHLRGDHARAKRAQATVFSRFDAARLLPDHADLVRSVAALPPTEVT